MAHQNRLIVWTLFLSLIFISVGSIDQTIHALYDDNLSQTSARIPEIAYLFDMNGVLFDTNKSAVFRQLGIRDTLSYVARNGSAKIKERFFEVLNQITQTDGNDLNVCDPDGMPLPQLMVDWMRGIKKSDNILNLITTAVEDNSDWFSGATEQRLIYRMASAIFNPKQFIASRCLIPDLVPFIKTLKKKGHKLYILSNWDSESFPLLKEKYKDFFELFDGIIISGECGYLKPQPEIFLYAKARIPTDIICFFDDQRENLIAAQEAGLCTVPVTRKNGLLKSSLDTTAIIRQANAILPVSR